MEIKFNPETSLYHQALLKQEGSPEKAKLALKKSIYTFQRDQGWEDWTKKRRKKL